MAGCNVFSPRIWVALLISYIVVLCTVFSQDNKLQTFPLWKQSFNSLSLDRVDDLGLHGTELLHFLRHNLRELVQNEVKASRHARISQYYDLVEGYLFNTQYGTGGGYTLAHSAVAKLTQDVTPISLHSHNDYWRSLPLIEALAHGAVSVEADVWLVPSILNASEYLLAVGHNERHLEPVNRTLDTLYTSPLMTMLNQVNVHINALSDTNSKSGVFFDNPGQTLYLYIDFKSKENEITYRVLMEKYLKPLIDANFVTYYDMVSLNIVENPITVILTGDYPRNLSIIDGTDLTGFYKDNKRYVFLESALHRLDEKIANASIVASSSLSQLLEDCGLSPYRTSWKIKLSNREAQCIKAHVDKAHHMGLKTRIWGVREWPMRHCKRLWLQQKEELGVDFLNADNLHEAGRL